MFDELRDLYQELILDHGRHPRHGRRLAAFDVTARGDNPMCGDRVQVWVRYGDANTIEATGFEARGCAISVASADLMAESVAGMAAPEVRTVFDAFRTLVTTGDCPACAALEALRPLAGVHEYPSRVKCATLPWHALMAALDGTREASSE
jgi:nitrogen fixation NifU-like protein